MENVEAEAADEEMEEEEEEEEAEEDEEVAPVFMSLGSECVCVCVCVCVENSPTSLKTARVHARTSISGRAAKVGLFWQANFALGPYACRF